MSPRAQYAILPDGRRHFHDGPIDLILEAFGPGAAAAYEAAARRFAGVLDELCEELPLLRAPSTAGGEPPRGRVARRMARAVARFHAMRFLTPMAAVAGAVAEELLEAMTSAAELTRAYVNNGGDIALHLTGEERFAIGMVDRPERPALIGRANLSARDAARGIATSGWRGRSFSLGLADAVTVVARDASTADAAATLIANAVDLPGHPAIRRVAARALDPQSDLGDRLVTRGVGALSSEDVARALASGVQEAQRFVDLGLVDAAALRLQDRTRLVGRDASLYKPASVARGELRHAEG